MYRTNIYNDETYKRKCLGIETLFEINTLLNFDQSIFLILF